eukprot:8433374-Pyramimonas_sp.AAC.1
MPGGAHGLLRGPCHLQLTADLLVDLHAPAAQRGDVACPKPAAATPARPRAASRATAPLPAARQQRA